MIEIWKPIEGFEGLYEVSNHGRVKSLKNGIVLKPGWIGNKNGHRFVRLCNNGVATRKLVHRLVASAFIPNPENKPMIDHIDADPTNNHVENLRWATAKENCNNETTRRRNSESKKGHPCYLSHHSEETKEKLRKANIGKKHTEESRKKMSESHIGVKLSESHRKALSDSHIGRIVTEETRAKLSESNRGKKRSEEARRKMSDAAKRRYARERGEII